jgi:hypothetical protein
MLLSVYACVVIFYCVTNFVNITSLMQVLAKSMSRRAETSGTELHRVASQIEPVLRVTCERNREEHIITDCLMAGGVVSCTVCSGKTCNMYEDSRTSCPHRKDCIDSRYCVGRRDVSFQPHDERAGCKMFIG